VKRIGRTMASLKPSERYLEDYDLLDKALRLCGGGGGGGGDRLDGHVSGALQQGPGTPNRSLLHVAD